MGIDKATLDELRTIKARTGIRSMLAYLNGLTEHRFTALYRFDDDSLQNVFFFDRERPEVSSCPTIPIMASYCVFVKNGKTTFKTCDSHDDARLNGHSKQMEVRSYCGVPLIGEDGKMFGTVCHFDYRALPITDDNVMLMERVAEMLRPDVGSLAS